MPAKKLIDNQQKMSEVESVYVKIREYLTQIHFNITPWKNNDNNICRQ